MFHLVSSIYTQLSKREQYNILILGLDNAGKTLFLEHIKLIYSNSENSKEILKNKRILPTVGQNTTTIPYDKSLLLKFWDLGGQKSLRSMWSRYYTNCHGIIFIIDSTDSERFQECCETLLEIANDQAWMDDTTISISVPILMLANKQDLPIAVDLVTLKSDFVNIVSLLEATDSKLLPVLVLENQGLKESLDWLVKRLVFNKNIRKPEYK